MNFLIVGTRLYSNLTFHSLNASPENSPGAASFGLDFGQRKGKLLYAIKQGADIYDKKYHSASGKRL